MVIWIPRHQNEQLYILQNVVMVIGSVTRSLHALQMYTFVAFSNLNLKKLMCEHNLQGVGFFLFRCTLKGLFIWKSKEIWSLFNVILITMLHLSRFSVFIKFLSIPHHLKNRCTIITTHSVLYFEVCYLETKQASATICIFLYSNIISMIR